MLLLRKRVSASGAALLANRGRVCAVTPMPASESRPVTVGQKALEICLI